MIAGKNSVFLMYYFYYDTGRWFKCLRKLYTHVHTDARDFGSLSMSAALTFNANPSAVLFRCPVIIKCCIKNRETGFFSEGLPAFSSPYFVSDLISEMHGEAGGRKHCRELTKARGDVLCVKQNKSNMGENVYDQKDHH